LFDTFVQKVARDYEHIFGGSGKGGVKLGFFIFILEVSDYYKDYKDTLKDNIYSFLEVLNNKRGVDKARQVT